MIIRFTLCFANHGQIYFQVGITTVMSRFEVGLRPYATITQC